jgi:hypothetical protein
MTVLLPDVYWPNGIAWRNNSLYISGFYNQRWGLAWAARLVLCVQNAALLAC